jgi:hypothetical protein
VPYWGRNTGVATARDVERRQIERKTDQVVAQRLGHELIDFIADRPGQAATMARRLHGAAAGSEGKRFKKAAISPTAGLVDAAGRRSPD